LSFTDRTVVAIDLGTTTIAAALVAVDRGEVLARQGALNPQRALGLDVISRLAVAKTAARRQELSSLVNGALEQLVAALLAAAPGAAAPEQIAIAGNTVMQHLLLGLPIDTLARPPYRPRDPGPQTVMTATLGWRRDLPLQLFPQPGGFVGGDLVAFLYGQGVSGHRAPRPEFRLFLDLGTNAEIALEIGDRLLATAAAAGPAFEAGNLSCGMVAVPGAVSALICSPDRPKVEVIGGGRAVGVCGSGAISTVAALRRAGVVTPSGQLLPPTAIASNLANYVIGEGSEAAFVLHRDARSLVVLSQEDIRQVQLAVAAVRAGIEVLLQRAGIAGDAGGEVVVTGSFGAALSPADLETIGLVPAGYAARSRFVHDGALAGVVRACIHAEGLAEVAQLATGVQVIPLSGTPLFEELFINHLNFPE